MSIPTPHIGAKSKDEIAKTVLMPGDPLRAKLVADNFLEDVTCFNTVRNMLGYTGTYKGKKVSVMGSGMGMPSIGIYSYELFNFYDVDNIIRVGSSGSISEKVNVKDIILAMGACTNSNYMSQYHLPGTFAPIADYKLLKAADEVATNRGLNVKVGNVLSSDTFYNVDAETATPAWKKMGVLAVEMEAAALYANATYAGKSALCILTVSDSILTGEALSAEERQTGFSQMLELALEIA